MVNKVILIGNLGGDPELRTTTAGGSVANLSVATTSRKKDNSGEWQDYTEWHRVVLFGGAAENAAKHLRKGSQVYIEGRLQTRKWTDKSGNDRWSTEVVCWEIKYLGKRRREEPPQNQGSEGGYMPHSGGDVPF